MQGYILQARRVRDEDIIAEILTSESLISCYRFYGARHSTILKGYKIDFELVHSHKFPPQLRSVIHLGFSWLLNRQTMLLWQQFVALLWQHLRGVDRLDEIYFNTLEYCAMRMHKQNPKRCMLESYLRILEFEGRLHSYPECFACELEIKEPKMALVRGFLPAHLSCVGAKNGLSKQMVLELLQSGKTTNLSDEQVDKVWDVMMLGL